MLINGEPAGHPLDAVRRGLITKCYLCGAVPAAVAVFVPYDEETKAAVIALRTTPLVDGKTPAVTYGLCAGHAAEIGPELAERVELKLLDEARELKRRAS